jgi:hypothetical protein
VDRPQPNQGRGIAAFGDVGKLIVQKLGGRLLNSAVERHTGMKDVDIAGAVGMAGTVLKPVVEEAYSGQQLGETKLDVVQRRVVWSFGLGGIAVLTLGGAWALWHWLGKATGNKEKELEE